MPEDDLDLGGQVDTEGDQDTDSDGADDEGVERRLKSRKELSQTSINPGLLSSSILDATTALENTAVSSKECLRGVCVATVIGS